MNLFSPPSNFSTQSFTGQLQDAYQKPSLLSADLFATLPMFTFGNLSSQMEPSGPGANMSEFFVGAGNHGEERMDTDDPILHSLQTLVEGRDLGQNLGEPQTFDMWFEQQ
jgi:hypothetical protein